MALSFTCFLVKLVMLRPFMLLSLMLVPPHLDNKDPSYFILAGMLDGFNIPITIIIIIITIIMKQLMCLACGANLIDVCGSPVLRDCMTFTSLLARNCCAKLAYRHFTLFLNHCVQICAGLLSTTLFHSMYRKGWTVLTCSGLPPVMTYCV